MSRNFAGSTDEVSLGDSLEHLAADYSVCCWFRVDTWDSAWQTIFSKGENSWRLGRSNATNNTQASIGLFPNESVLAPVLDVSDTVYRHACLTWDQSIQTLEYFIAGVSQGTDATEDSGAVNAFNALIGENDDATGRSFKGDVCEFVFFNRLLTAVEITALANGINTKMIGPANQLAYLPLLGSFATEPDFSGNSITGTPTGTTHGIHAPVEMMENFL
jgi:hypothetical protein